MFNMIDGYVVLMAWVATAAAARATRENSGGNCARAHDGCLQTLLFLPCHPTDDKSPVPCAQLPQDGLYVEGSIVVGGTGTPICFSSDQAITIPMCNATTSVAI